MVQARGQDRPVAKRSLGRRRVVVRTVAGTKAGSVAASDEAEVSVSKTHFDRIAGRPRLLGKVLAGYADTFARAEKEGRPITMTFRVSPNGAAEPIAPVLEGDALDVAMAAATERGRAKIADILKDRNMLSARAFGSLIGASHETVNVKRKRHEILGLEGPTRGIKYPSWQVTDAGLPLPGLARLFTALDGRPWTIYRFLRTAHAELGGRTALDALKAQEIDAVLEIAENQVTGVFT